MRVLVVSHLFPSTDAPYCGQFVYEQVQALSVDVEVTVLSARLADEHPVGAEALENVEIEFVRLQAPMHLPSWLGVFVRALKLRRVLRSELSRVSYDVVHAHYALPDGYAAVSEARRAGVPSVVTLHGSDVNRQLRRPVVGGFLARRIARASRVICVSPAMPPILGRISSALAERCTLIPNGFNAQEIGFDENGDRDCILFVGGLTDVKQPAVLLDAYSGVAGELRYDLVFAGDGPLRKALEARAVRLGLRDRVHFLGSVPHAEMRSLYARAVMTVLPSRSEGMPITALETLASGVPLVCTPVGALPELIHEGVNGLLVPSGDAAALASALRSASALSWDRGRIAGDDRLLTWSQVAALIVGQYTALVAGVAG